MSMMRRAMAATGENISTATTSSAPARAASIASKPVPVPMSSTTRSSPSLPLSLPLRCPSSRTVRSIASEYFALRSESRSIGATQLFVRM